MTIDLITAVALTILIAVATTTTIDPWFAGLPLNAIVGACIGHALTTRQIRRERRAK